MIVFLVFRSHYSSFTLFYKNTSRNISCKYFRWCFIILINSYISHDIYKVMYVKYFVFYVVKYLIVFYRIPHDVYHKLHKKIVCLKNRDISPNNIL